MAVTVTEEPYGGFGKYAFENEECSMEKGFARLLTGRDSSAIGSWVNPLERVIVMYDEGDVTTIRCDTDRELGDEMDSFRNWNNAYGYGPVRIDASLTGDALQRKLIERGLGELLRERSVRGHLIPAEVLGVEVSDRVRSDTSAVVEAGMVQSRDEVLAAMGELAAMIAAYRAGTGDPAAVPDAARALADGVRAATGTGVLDRREDARVVNRVRGMLVGADTEQAVESVTDPHAHVEWLFRTDTLAARRAFDRPYPGETDQQWFAAVARLTRVVVDAADAGMLTPGVSHGLQTVVGNNLVSYAVPSRGTTPAELGFGPDWQPLTPGAVERSDTDIQRSEFRQMLLMLATDRHPLIEELRAVEDRITPLTVNRVLTVDEADRAAALVEAIRTHTLRPIPYSDLGRELSAARIGHRDRSAEGPATVTNTDCEPPELGGHTVEDTTETGPALG
ncbi:hypothetical protein ACL02S_23455 [Nocardia sp. 004]|uniref:hypothetical protein n=1 Tax=Nocardia sp. 004 TaxID=3385978 RepID=UPI0039A0E375